MNLTQQDIEHKLIVVQNQNVILDSDVAALYGVETKRVNEAIKNNPDKFPDGYILALTSQEWNVLKSKFSTSIRGGKTKLPKAFTEKGLYMLATILKSPVATQATIGIIETFAKVKELARTMAEFQERPEYHQRQTLAQKSEKIIGELLNDDMETTRSETTVECNLIVFKLSHKITREPK